MFRFFSTQMSLIALLVSVAYSQNFDNVYKSNSSAEVLGSKFADVIIDLTITNQQVLDQINNILPYLNLTDEGTHRLVLPHEDFVYLRNSIDFLEYDVIEPVTNLPFKTFIKTNDEITMDLAQETLGWEVACTVQGNIDAWHDGDWTEGVSSTSKISYSTWGCLGCDIWNTWGSAYWSCNSINPSSSQVKLTYRLMSIESGAGQYVEIYFRNFSDWSWVGPWTFTDKSDHYVVWALTESQTDAYLSSDGRFDFIAGSNDGYVFDVIEFEYSCPTPAIPSLYSPSNGATCVAYSPTSFDWSSVSGATGYEIYISPGGTYTTTSSSYSKTLSPNTTYTWKVRAVNDCGSGSWSSSRTFTTKGSPGTPSLSSPSNGATCVAYGPTNFDWGSVSGATQYEIYISPGGTYTTTPSNYSRTLNPGTTYTWKVRAKNSCGVWGSWSSTRTFTTVSTPGSPSLTSPTNGSTGVDPSPVNFDWSSVSGATQYEINISPGGTYTASSSNYSRTIDTCTTYSWRVKAKNSCDVWGDWSVTWNFTTDCPQQLPTVITSAATNVSTSSATLNGTVNPNGSSTTYYFEYGTTTSYGTQIPTPPGSAGSGTSNVSVSTSVPGLTPSTTYHYRLVASNSGGTSNNGNDQTFITTGTVAIDDKHYMPLSYALKPAYPNPFNPGTSIGFALPKATRITLIVYDIWGREVYRLVDSFFGPGNYKVEWQGIHENGQECSTGIYVARMVTPGFTSSTKMVLMK